MTLPYELALELKNQGWKQPEQMLNARPNIGAGEFVHDTEARPDGSKITHTAYSPSLSELIGGCGDGFISLMQYSGNWEVPRRPTLWVAAATGCDIAPTGPTPEEAVARLWLELQNNKKIDMASSSHVA